MADGRQHVFLAKNMAGLCDSLTVSLNDNIHSSTLYRDELLTRY